MNAVTWDYEEPSEEGYYHVWGLPGPFEDEALFTLTAPQTPENDADVQAIVDAIDRIAARLKQEQR